MKRIDLVPPLVGTGAGLVDGTLRTFAPTALGGHVPTLYSAALLASGMVGWAMTDRPGDVTYTLASVGLYGLSARVVPQVDSMLKKSSSTSGGRIAAARAAGCTTCGDRVAAPAAARPLIAQPVLVTNPPGGSRESAPGIL